MKIFYWSPFFSNVATISAVLNSAKSLIKFKKNCKYDVSIINAIGEWNDYKKISPKEIIFKDLTKKNWCQIIPKNGFLKSRLSYLFIFIVNIRRLLKLINSEKPDYLIIHLITSLPIFLSPFFILTSNTYYPLPLFIYSFSFLIIFPKDCFSWLPFQKFSKS